MGKKKERMGNKSHKDQQRKIMHIDAFISRQFSKNLRRLLTMFIRLLSGSNKLTLLTKLQIKEFAFNEHCRHRPEKTLNLYCNCINTVERIFDLSKEY